MVVKHPSLTPTAAGLVVTMTARAPNAPPKAARPPSLLAFGMCKSTVNTRFLSVDTRKVRLVFGRITPAIVLSVHSEEAGRGVVWYPYIENAGECRGIDSHRVMCKMR